MYADQPTILRRLIRLPNLFLRLLLWPGLYTILNTLSVSSSFDHDKWRSRERDDDDVVIKSGSHCQFIQRLNLLFLWLKCTMAPLVDEPQSCGMHGKDESKTRTEQSHHRPPLCPGGDDEIACRQRSLG